MFIALLGKELRQLRLWGMLWLTCMLLAVSYTVNGVTRLLSRLNLPHYISNMAAEIPFTDSRGFGTMYCIFMVFCGIVLGLAQVSSERKTWQFLLHRPVTRLQVALAKMLAGTLWYAVAVLLPLALLAGYAAGPGHFAGPLRLSMLYPFLVMLLAGWMGYCAALLTMLRRARWYGTRLAPFIAAGYLLFILQINTSLMAMGTFILCAAAVLAWAALVALCRREL